MRKLIVSSFVSLDGVIESPMTWTSPFFDDESKEYAYTQLADVEFFLLGRVTYDVFSARWPSEQTRRRIQLVDCAHGRATGETRFRGRWGLSAQAGSRGRPAIQHWQCHPQIQPPLLRTSVDDPTTDRSEWFAMNGGFDG